MALTTTTLSAAYAVGDRSILVASATGFAAGYFVLIDGVFYRVSKAYVSGTTIILDGWGLEGTVDGAHQITSNVTVGLASDFATPAAQTTVPAPIAGIAWTKTSYTAAGAIALPSPGSNAIAIINGTAAIAMTLANPTKDMDGSLLLIVGNGKSTSTVTYTAGFGNAGSGYDVATFPAGGQVAILAVACNGFWVSISAFGGTVTSIVPAIA